jgi:cellobiose phosphorylase
MYPYLTGSASWYLFTLVTEAFGVKGHLGDMMLAPKLVKEQFNNDGIAQVITHFAGRELNISYYNPARLDFDEYQIATVNLDGLPIDHNGKMAILSRSIITTLEPGESHNIRIELE